MSQIIKKTLLNVIYQTSKKEINNAIDGKCIFLCYQPNIPEKIKNKIKKNN